MQPLPPVLAVLRHALADPISAATVKAEVLAARLRRDAPALADRTQDLLADLTVAGRLLDLLASLAAIEEEAPEESDPGRVAGRFAAAEAADFDGRPIRVRPVSFSDALRRVVAFGVQRGALPRVVARPSPGGVEIAVEDLGPAPPPPVERLLLLPASVPGAEDLFLARAAVAADGGTLALSEKGGRLEATISWRPAVGRA